MAAVVTLISTLTPSGSSATLTFSTIPGTYDDLMLLGSMKGSTGPWAPAASGNFFTINGVASSSAYSYTRLNQYGTGGAEYQNQDNAEFPIQPIPGSNASDGNAGSIWLYLAGYTNAGKKMNIQMITGTGSNSTNGSAIATFYTGQTLATTAITQLDFTCGNGNFLADGKMSLYGITNA